ncbi:MAG: class I SAM-dependent methyltransferase [Candidatus Promineifilaceae bacterium]|nr:class I SAM-dependent methyltransferase [Candidatus Promineifilaceae bacterium]
MDDAVFERLLAINKAFYARFSQPFLESRRRPQPGFHRLLDFLPKACQRLLDVGCADGRLGRFLLGNRAITSYVGIDFSRPLLQAADKDERMRFVERDLANSDSFAELGRFDAATCLATLQHIPRWSHRIQLLTAIGDCVRPGGSIIASTWQFRDYERQRRKIVDWARVGLNASDVENDDYLLTWRRAGLGYRYVRFINLEEMGSLARSSGLQLLTHFRSDGREGDLNLYAVMVHADGTSDV